MHRTARQLATLAASYSRCHDYATTPGIQYEGGGAGNNKKEAGLAVKHKTAIVKVVQEPWLY